MTDCIFCHIRDGDIPSHKVYEDEHTYAFLDINPVHLGHTLVIPKQHSLDVLEIAENDWVAVMRTVHLLAPKVKEAAHSDGINIIMNNRRSAGQLVDHSHVHIVPRFADDGFKGLPQHEESSEALATMASSITDLL